MGGATTIFPKRLPTERCTIRAIFSVQRSGRPGGASPCGHAARRHNPGTKECTMRQRMIVSLVLGLIMSMGVAAPLPAMVAARQATPAAAGTSLPIAPDPALCQVEPRPAADLEAPLARSRRRPGRLPRAAGHTGRADHHRRGDARSSSSPRVRTLATTCASVRSTPMTAWPKTSGG